MKKIIIAFVAVIAALAAILFSLTGCEKVGAGASESSYEISASPLSAVSGEETDDSGSVEISAAQSAAEPYESFAQSEIAEPSDESDSSGQDEDSSFSEELSSSAEESSSEPSEPVTGDAVQIFFDSSIKADGAGIAVSGNTATITAGGSYEISGSSADGALIINTEEKVRLILNGLTLTNKAGGPIYAENAKRLEIVLADGTTNTLSDASSYSGEYSGAKAALFANDTLEIKGSGTLKVTGSYKHAIASDDDIIIDGATVIVVSAVSDGLHANDNINVKSGSVTVSGCGSDAFESEGTLNISGGTLNLKSGGEGLKCATAATISGGMIEIDAVQDGIKASSVDSPNSCAVLISGGSIKITALQDGIQSDGSLTLRNGDDGSFDGYNLYITSGGGSSAGSDLTDESESCKGIKSGSAMTVTKIFAFISSADDALHSNGTFTVSGGSVTIKTGMDGVQSAGDISISGGDFDIETKGVAETSSTIGSFGGMGGRPGGMGGRPGGMQESSSQSFANSCKGIKSDEAINISGGSFIINSDDDGVHAGADITVSGGKFTISTGDDGIHSDATLFVNGGADITVTKSYEGLEGEKIEISGGTVHITASDDGLNAASGSSIYGGMTRPGIASANNHLIISNAYVYVNSGGDGLDSNGALTINSGTVIVDGPTNSGNSPIDADGTRLVNGGTLIAAGSSGMLESPAQTSGQNCLVIVFRSTQRAGTSVCVKDGAGNTVVCFTPDKDFSSLTVSTSAFQKNSEYYVYTGGTPSGTLKDGLYTGSVTYTGGTARGNVSLNQTVKTLTVA